MGDEREPREPGRDVVRTPRPPEGPAPAEGRFEIVPEQPDAVVGRALYSVPMAIGERPDGRLLCDWSFEHDPAGAAPRAARRPGRANYYQPRPRAYWDWESPGQHKVICDVRFERHQGAGASRPAPSPPRTGRLELPVHVRTLTELSRSRFESTATPASYERARLAPYVEAERARQDCRVEDADTLERRNHRIEDMREHSARIDENRRVIARAQLTLRDGSRTMPLAIVIGQATSSPQQFLLVDFTPNVGRMDYTAAASADECVRNLENRNAYPAGLVEIQIPRNNHGIAPLHRTFETTGESSTGGASRVAGDISMGATVAGVATLEFPPLAAVLFIVAGVAGAVSSGLSLIDRLHEARPSGTSIAVDSLGVVSSLLGGGAAAFTGRVVNIGGRSLRVVNMLGGAALAADAGSLVAMSVDAMREVQRLQRDTSLSEDERRRQIARIVVSVAAVGGLVVVSGGQQAAAVRQPHASRPAGQPFELGQPHETGQPARSHDAPETAQPHQPHTTEAYPGQTGDGMGLRSHGSLDRVVGRMHVLEDRFRTTATTPQARALELQRSINDELHALGIPSVSVEARAIPDLGHFDPRTWRVVLSEERLTGDIAAHDFARLVNTLVHEARHVEQWYLIIRLARHHNISPANMQRLQQMVQPQALATVLADTRPLTPQQHALGGQMVQALFNETGITARVEAYQRVHQTQAEFQEADAAYNALRTGPAPDAPFRPEVPMAQREAAIARRNAASEAQDAAYAAYRAMPHEADAFAAGETAQRQFRPPGSAP